MDTETKQLLKADLLKAFRQAAVIATVFAVGGIAVGTGVCGFIHDHALNLKDAIGFATASGIGGFVGGFINRISDPDFDESPNI